MTLTGEDGGVDVVMLEEMIVVEAVLVREKVMVLAAIVLLVDCPFLSS